MFGPLSDLRQWLNHGQELNQGGVPAVGQDTAGKSNKSKEARQVQDSRAKKGAAPDPGPVPVLVPALAPSPPPVPSPVADKPASSSCKRSCPHYHGNAPPPKPRGKAVCRTIHEITEEADVPRQHVRCQDPDCPAKDSYCKICCPSFSCTHTNELPRPTIPSARPRSPKKLGTDVIATSLHDHLYKGKGKAVLDPDTRRNITSLLSLQSGGADNASTVSRHAAQAPIPQAPTPRSKAVAFTEPHPSGSSTDIGHPHEAHAEPSYNTFGGDPERGDGYDADDDAEQQEDGLHLDVPLKTVIKLAIAFFFIYSAMNSLSEYVTSLLPSTLGDESLFMIQTVLCASSLAAPRIVTNVGELRAMVLGGLTHVVYLLVLMYPSRIFVLVSSGFCGFGASLVWVAQGAFLTKCSPPSRRGLFAGVFWGIYYFADIVGNLVAYLVFRFSSQIALFGIGATSAFVGVLLLFLMDEQHQMIIHRSQHPLYQSLRGSDRRNVRRSAPRSIAHVTTEVLLEAQRTYERWLSIIIFVFLTPMTIYVGFESAFWTGEFTKLLPTTTIGLVLLCTGVGQVLGAFLLSWLSDHFQYSSPTFCIGAACSVGGLLICIPLEKTMEQKIPFPGPKLLDTPLIAYIGGFLFGIADGVLTSHMFAIIGRLFPTGKEPEIWALFNLLGNGGAAITYWLGIVYPLSQKGGFSKQILAQVVVLCIGTPLYIIIDIGAAYFIPIGRRVRTRAITLA